MPGIEIKQPHLLFVEGKEDKYFFEALVEGMEVTNVQIEDYGGKDNLRKSLRALKTSHGFYRLASLGVVRDADEDPHAAFQSVRDALMGAGLPVPHKPLEIVPEKPAVAVIILPDSSSKGSLEDLCLRAFADDAAMGCVENFFQCLNERTHCLPNYISKAKIQVFLASRPRPLRLGEAAEAGYLPLDAKAFQPLKDIIAKLTQRG